MKCSDSYSDAFPVPILIKPLITPKYDSTGDIKEIQTKKMANTLQAVPSLAVTAANSTGSVTETETLRACIPGPATTTVYASITCQQRSLESTHLVNFSGTGDQAHKTHINSTCEGDLADDLISRQRQQGRMIQDHVESNYGLGEGQRDNDSLVQAIIALPFLKHDAQFLARRQPRDGSLAWAAEDWQCLRRDA